MFGEVMCVFGFFNIAVSDSDDVTWSDSLIVNGEFQNKRIQDLLS
jgi:hypothetical protein